MAMSEYNYHDRSRPRHRTRERERQPEYVSETTYMERGGRGAADAGSPQEEYRQNIRPRRGHDEYNDDYYDYNHYSDDYEQRPKPQRRRSVGDNLKEYAKTAGLGGVIGTGTDALTKGKCDSSDSESTTDMEQKRTKLKRKELITAGLATVATIQAARGVYTSMTASDNRRKLLSEGEISPEEARRRKTRNLLQDAVAVGIASLGIKSAFSQWKEMNEQRYSVNEIETRRRKRSNMHKHPEKEDS